MNKDQSINQQYICILCPTRGRPEGLNRMWSSAKSTAENPDCLKLWVTIDDDDQQTYAGKLPSEAKIAIGGDSGVVHYINRMAEWLLPDLQNVLFYVAADDTVFTTPHWDTALLNHYNSLSNKVHVYSLLDSRDERGTPHPIVTREYVAMMGYFYPPIFMHWYVDTWTRKIAQRNNVFTHLKEFMLKHDKPSDKGIIDQTHSRIRMRGWNDRDSSVDKLCNHFLSIEAERLGTMMQLEAGTREHMD